MCASAAPWVGVGHGKGSLGIKGRAMALACALRLGVTDAAVALAAQRVQIPSDSDTTVFLSDSLEGYGAVGGVAADGLGYV